ncbi:unnamed protein product [Rhizophagus irregularis]|nr:unnamed protein product [Rhizophagus irregularis]
MTMHYFPNNIPRQSFNKDSEETITKCMKNWVKSEKKNRSPFIKEFPQSQANMPAVNINRKYFISMVSESVVQEDRKSYLNHFVEEIFQRKKYGRENEGKGAREKGQIESWWTFNFVNCLSR